MNRIDNVFVKKESKLFIAYLVCGDPDLNTTFKLMNNLVKSGVDIIELGMPFTDPIADGPIIQKSVERALRKKTSLINVLDLVKKFRKSNKKTPVVLMGYLNPIENLGYEKFAMLSEKSQVDGVLIVDSPPEESECLEYALSEKNIHSIYLASPTTDKKRLKEISRKSSGYLYYVSLKGITGSKINRVDDISKKIKSIRNMSNKNLPIAVGFGIKDSVTARKISRIADGIIIGSSIVELIEENLHNRDKMISKINKFAANISNALVRK